MHHASPPHMHHASPTSHVPLTPTHASRAPLPASTTHPPPAHAPCNFYLCRVIWAPEQRPVGESAWWTSWFLKSRISSFFCHIKYILYKISPSDGMHKNGPLMYIRTFKYVLLSLMRFFTSGLQTTPSGPKLDIISDKSTNQQWIYRSTLSVVGYWWALELVLSVCRFKIKFYDLWNRIVGDEI